MKMQSFILYYSRLYSSIWLPTFFQKNIFFIQKKMATHAGLEQLHGVRNDNKMFIFGLTITLSTSVV